MQFYSLSYMVQHEEYNLTLLTTLTPLDAETYNSSFTIINYAPAGKSEPKSLESVKFNFTVTLSQQYAILSKVAKEVGKAYEKSVDETLAELAQGYYIMEDEAKGLSKLVEKQLQEYNKVIINIFVILMDDACSFQCGTLCGLIGVPACTVLAAALCPGWSFICYPVCTILWSGACAGVCSYVCSGFQGVSPCDVGCNTFCTVFSIGMCAQLGPFAGVCEILLIPVCNGVCAAYCG